MCNNSAIKSKLTSNNKEKVILSTLIYKFNENKQRQKRILCLTNFRLFNIRPTKAMDPKTLFLSEIRRTIELKKLTRITASIHSDQFVLHVPSEYDYRYETYVG